MLQVIRNLKCIAQKNIFCKNKKIEKPIKMKKEKEKVEINNKNNNLIKCIIMQKLT